MDAVAALLFSKRHEWMQQKLVQSFSVDPAVAEKALRDNKKRVDVFLSEPASPPKLFFFYQPRFPGGAAELFLSVGGEGERLDSKAVYFLRDSNKPVNLKQAQDATVLSGEIGLDILQSFQASLSEVYFPLLQQQSEWGRIKAGREKSAFLESVHAFQSELSRKIANLHGDLQLAAPPAPYDSIEQKPAAFLKASKDKQTVDACLASCSAWCAAISGYLAADSSNQPIAASVESGPEVEIDYWSRRMLTLISITEQLKGQACKGVIGVLRARAGRSEVDDGLGLTNHKKADEDAAEQEACKQLLERWREVDLQITDGLNEAKDNVRFLDNLRQVIDPLYSGQPRSISDGMGSLMSSMKMIHTLSRYYGTDVRMTNLFQRITNQIIANCRHFILHGPPVSSGIGSAHAGSAPAANGDDAASISDSQRLWQTEPAVLISRMQDSISLYDAYLYQYRLIRQKLSALPKGKQFHFDESAIFSKLTRFRRRLEKLCDMFSAVDQFRELRVKRLDGLDELLFSFEKLVADFRAKNAYDLLEYGNVQFERDFVEFTMHCSGLENALTEHIGKCLTACSSIDKQLDLMVQFSSILSRRAHLSEEMEAKYCTIFRLYGDELNAIQALYEKYPGEPSAGPQLPARGRQHPVVASAAAPHHAAHEELPAHPQGLRGQGQQAGRQALQQAGQDPDRVRERLVQRLVQQQRDGQAGPALSPDRAGQQRRPGRQLRRGGADADQGGQAPEPDGLRHPGLSAHHPAARVQAEVAQQPAHARAVSVQQDEEVDPRHRPAAAGAAPAAAVGHPAAGP